MIVCSLQFTKIECRKIGAIEEFTLINAESLRICDPGIPEVKIVGFLISLMRLISFSSCKKILTDNIRVNINNSLYILSTMSHAYLIEILQVLTPTVENTVYEVECYLK